MKNFTILQNSFLINLYENRIRASLVLSLSLVSASVLAQAPVYVTDFENGATGWQTNVAGNTALNLTSVSPTWHLTSVSGGLQPDTFQSVVYGLPNNGQLGAEHSYLQSPQFFFKYNTASVTFDSYTSNEGDHTKPYDLETVEMSLDGGQTWQAMHPAEADGLNNMEADGVWRNLSYTKVIPQNSNVSFRFRFDTGDASGRTDTVAGWYIDNVMISSEIIFETQTQAVSCVGSTDGSLTIQNVYGGEPPYEYSIDNGQNFQASPSFSPLAPGFYTVVVRDSVGYLSKPEKVRVQEPDPVAFTAIKRIKNCDGNSIGAITLNGSGGNPPYMYSINGGQSFQASSQFTGLAMGVYQVQLRDKNGCISNIDTVGLRPVEQLRLVCHATDGNCLSSPNGILTLEATGGQPPYKYSVDGGKSFRFSNVFTNLNAGEYNIIIKDDYNCALTDVRQLRVLPTFTASAGQDQLIYNELQQNNCVTLSGSASDTSGGFSYEWSTGETTPTVTVCPMQTTQYTLRVKNATGCTIVDTVTVEVLDKTLDQPGKIDPGVLQAADSYLQAFPNPFLAETTIFYRIDKEKDFSLELYDITGRKLDVLAKGDEVMASRQRAYNLDAELLPEGCYIVRLRCGDDMHHLRLIQRK